MKHNQNMFIVSNLDFQKNISAESNRVSEF